MVKMIKVYYNCKFSNLAKAYDWSVSTSDLCIKSSFALVVSMSGAGFSALISWHSGLEMQNKQL